MRSPKDHETSQLHVDAGLQPERTDLAWIRTTLALVVVGAIFLRWVPHYGWFAGALVAAATMISITINMTRKHRFHRGSLGIRNERMPADLISTFFVASSVVVLAAAGVFTVLFLPLQ
ncbi:DUF202 domain-containing protein [uncultured Arthrobacter sp.]|uniref:DUF202 domain-containing protein n=1 Tax=uncultured Arthrobacter sp. TaxID=114050 RepID=UPI002633F0CA|nr:DUF202 domain-containing protein [uncultured Arthrobacter sp.]